MKLSKRIQNIQPSATIAIHTAAMELQRQGIDIADLTAGQPDFPTPDKIKEAGIEGIRKNFTRYTPITGMYDLRVAIAEKLARDNQLEYKPDDILVSCGGKHSLYLAIQVLLEQGDEAIVISPYWTSYPPQVELTGAKPVIVPTEQEHDFKITRATLEKAVTPNTRVLILNNPNNPTGTLYSKDDLEQIAEIAIKHNIYIITDEIYEKLVYDGLSAVSIASLNPEIKNLTITINGMSKSYSMTGWRIGYAAGPKEIITAMTRLQTHEISHPASIAQYASIEAFRNCENDIEIMRQEFEKRRNFIVERLRQIKGIVTNVPQGAFYIFPRVDAFYGKRAGDTLISNSEELCLYLLKSCHLGVVPGSGFGDDRFIRISFAQSMETLREGVKRLEEGLKKLK